MEVVVASSSVDGGGIGCWDLQTGSEQLRYRACVSPRHGLICVGEHFIASSQLQKSSSNSGSVKFWSWNKPHPEVTSFLSEPIRPLISNHSGTYVFGGGVSGHIYAWEVATGRMLQSWYGHYRSLTCLVLSDDESFLISGSEDGSVRVWSLLLIFDDVERRQAKSLYEYSFSEHTLPVTDIVTGYGGSNAIIVSASEDRNCKIWSIAKGRLIRTVLFPSIIDAIALDPGEHVFYAGGIDGKIYIAALNAQSTSSSKYGMHILGSLSDHSKAITCLAFGADGTSLVSGSEDGVVRVWDTKTRNIVRIFRHAKGPINNVIVVRRSHFSISWASQASSGRKHWVPPRLATYANPSDQDLEFKSVIASDDSCDVALDASYISAYVMNNQIRELQQLGSCAAIEAENERLKLDCERSMQMVEQWKKMYNELHEFCATELVGADQTGVAK